MTQGESVPHVADDMLLEYFDERLSDEQSRSVEEHLADCDNCAHAAREIHDFVSIWDQWTAVAHGRAHFEQILTAALDQAERLTPGWASRLQQWRARVDGLAEAAVHVVATASAEAARVLARSVDSILRPGSQWQLSPAGVGIRGNSVGRQDSTLLISRPDGHGPRLRIAIRAGQSGEITVRIDTPFPAGQPPLALLVDLSAEPDRAIYLSEVEPGPEADYWIARFRDVRPGEYIVALEPSSAAPDEDA